MSLRYHIDLLLLLICILNINGFSISSITRLTSEGRLEKECVIRNCVNNPSLSLRNTRWLEMKKRKSGAVKKTLPKMDKNYARDLRRSDRSFRIDESLLNDKQKFINVLRTRYSHEDSLDFTEASLLNDLVKQYCDHLDDKSFSVMIYSLGMINNMSPQWNLDEIARSNIKISFNKRVLSSNSLKSDHIISSLLGFSRLKFSWKDMKSDKLEELLICYVNSGNIGDVMWSLGSMEARWTYIPDNLKSKLQSAIEVAGSQFSAYALSSALWALAKMGVNWNWLTIKVRDCIITRLMELSEDMNPQQSSKSVWALGSLCCPQNAISMQCLEILSTNMNKIKRSQTGSGIASSQLLTGLAKMQLDWKMLSDSMRSDVLEHIVRVCHTTNDRGIANSVWSLGSMRVPKVQMSNAICSIVFRGSASALRSCSHWSLSNILWGLARCGFEWSELGDELREAIMANVARVAGQMNSVDVGVVVWSLGSKEAPLYSLPKFFKEAILAATEVNLERVKSQELASLIWGFSGCGMSWDMLPPTTAWSLNVALRRLGSDLSAQDVANCAYGLALLAFDAANPSDPAFRGAHEVILNAVVKASRALSGCNKELEQLRIFAQYMALRKEVTDGQKLPAELLQDSSEEAPAAQISSSQLQTRVVEGVKAGLSELGDAASEFRIVNEVSSFNGVFPVDAIIFRRGEVIAMVEIDGPSHYRDDGQLRRKDLLKEHMYTMLHPRSMYRRVRWDEANKLGADVVGAEIADEILQTAETLNPGNVQTWVDGMISVVKKVLA